MSGDYTTAIKPARPQPDLLPHEVEVRVVMQYEGKTETVLMKRRRTTFGRGDADVVTADPTMSRKHFQVEVARTGVVLHDLASANGTIHKGRWITFANLHDGESFQAGNTRFVVSIRTTNLVPARLAALVALEGDEASSLARLLDGDLFAVRTIEPNVLMEACRSDLPDLLITEASPRELTAVENLKRLPRLKNTHVIVLLGPENAYLSERCHLAGADEVLDRPVSLEAIEDIASRLAEKPQSRALNFPASIRMEGYGEAHGRLLELQTLQAKVRVTPSSVPPAGTVVNLKLLLPNEYGVVQVRAEWRDYDGELATIGFTSFDGNGQLIIRRILRDAPMRSVSFDR
jgi:CheY-like chemotaxis protein